jgi:hypothetical protein
MGKSLVELKAGELKAGELKAGELKAGELKAGAPKMPSTLWMVPQCSMYSVQAV